MTGFPRPHRSYYLDDMDVTEGSLVRCKCACDNPNFTAGWLYMVREGGTIMDNTGAKVVPSVRFTYN